MASERQTNFWAWVRQVLILCGLAALPATGTLLWHPGWTVAPKLRAHEVELATVRSWRQPILWIDARSEAEFGRHHIPGAVLLNESEWDRHVPAVLDAWRPGTRIVVYCSTRGCAASEAVANRLRTSLGLPEVYFLHGGIEAWSNTRK